MTDASRLLRLSCCSCWCWNDVKMRLYVIAHCWWLLTSLTIRSKYTVYRYPLGIADNSSHRLRVKTIKSLNTLGFTDNLVYIPRVYFIVVTTPSAEAWWRLKWRRRIQVAVTRGRFQREHLETAFLKLFWQWEHRSQERNSALVICYTFCVQKHPVTQFASKLAYLRSNIDIFQRGHSPSSATPSGAGDSGTPLSINPRVHSLHWIELLTTLIIHSRSRRVSLASNDRHL